LICEIKLKADIHLYRVVLHVFCLPSSWQCCYGYRWWIPHCSSGWDCSSHVISLPLESSCHVETWSWVWGYDFYR